MNDFDYDIIQKKRIAQNAKHRKRGSKSRKCTLSTDHMTFKQWKDRNGEVMSYPLNKPLSWEAFKAASQQTQVEYLQNLIQRYNVNATSLSVMFGVQPQTVRRHIEANGLGITFRVGNSMTAQECEAWSRFLNGNEEESSSPKEHHSHQKIFLDRFTLSFNGKIDPATVANSILSIAGSDAVGRIEITCFIDDV